jgi:methyl-accepting chemotaxis protein
MQATAIPSNELTPKPKPPSRGEPERDAIGSLVDKISIDLGQRITEVREMLDQIEQQALESAVSAKGTLQDHVAVCERLSDEVGRLKTVVIEIKKQVEG